MGFPPVTEMPGMVCRIQMSTKYTENKWICTVSYIAKLVEQVQGHKSEHSVGC